MEIRIHFHDYKIYQVVAGHPVSFSNKKGEVIGSFRISLFICLKLLLTYSALTQNTGFDTKKFSSRTFHGCSPD